MTEERMMDDEELVSIIAHGIAEAQGDAYAEYSSEFDGYAKAALDALKKSSAQLSIDGITVWGRPYSIEMVLTAIESHRAIEGERMKARHWREECGKIHAKFMESRGALRRVGMIVEEERDGLSGQAIERLSDAVHPVLIALELVK